MITKAIKIFSWTLLFSCMVTAYSMSAASANEIKARMKERIPVITELKAKGVIGENNKGYLEFRGTKEKEDVVNSENADREIVYTAIGKQQKTTAVKVGERRAIQIAGKATAGTLIQKSDGTWGKK
jgi:uncharacterized protein